MNVCAKCKYADTPSTERPCYGCREAVGEGGRDNFEPKNFVELADILKQSEEADPHGKDPHESGAKLDAGKNRLGLVMFGFSRALQAVGEIGTYGANKYTDDGWISVPDGEKRYTDALLRHLLKEATGEERDPDTDLLHAAHAAWNALARLDLIIRSKE